MKKYLVIEHHKFTSFSDDWTIKFANVDEDVAFEKLVALRTLNEDRQDTSYHLQEVSFSAVDKPLILTDEVKQNSESNQEELPF